jgi:hypothetical protein
MQMHHYIDNVHSFLNKIGMQMHHYIDNVLNLIGTLIAPKFI